MIKYFRWISQKKSGIQNNIINISLNLLLLVLTWVMHKYNFSVFFFFTRRNLIQKTVLREVTAVAAAAVLHVCNQFKQIKLNKFCVSVYVLEFYDFSFLLLFVCAFKSFFFVKNVLWKIWFFFVVLYQSQWQYGEFELSPFDWVRLQFSFSSNIVFFLTKYEFLVVPRNLFCSTLFWKI